MREAILKLLEEVDEDIRGLMLKKVQLAEEYEMWQLIDNPGLFIVEWQRMRDFKKQP